MDFQATQRLQKVGKKYLAVQQAKINQLNAQGANVLNLGRGNPDQPTFPKIVATAHEALKQPKNHGYPPYGGKPTLKQSIREFYREEFGVTIEDDEVTIFSGSAAALTALPMVLANAHDVVLTPTPAFMGYHIGIAMADADEYLMPLTAENNYFPDLAAIPTDVRKKATMMFLNYPHNPTGAGATHEFFDQVVQFGLDNQIAIIHDFAYADISFDHPAPSFLQSARAKETGIEIYTLSKTFNMAGWRLAFAVGNRSIINLLKQYVQNSVGGTFGVVQDAGVYGLEHQKEERQQLRELYLTRRNVAIEELKLAGLTVENSQGTFFVWAKLPSELANDRQFAQGILNEQHVAVVPGSAFGEAGHGYFRLSLVADEAVLRKGIRKIGNYLKEHGKKVQ